MGGLRRYRGQKVKIWHFSICLEYSRVASWINPCDERIIDLVSFFRYLDWFSRYSTRREKSTSAATRSFSAIIQPYTLNPLSNTGIWVSKWKVLNRDTRIYVQYVIWSICSRDTADKLSSKTKRCQNQGSGNARFAITFAIVMWVGQMCALSTAETHSFLLISNIKHSNTSSQCYTCWSLDLNLVITTFQLGSTQRRLRS